MAMKRRRARVLGHPALDEGAPGLVVAFLVEDVGPRVRGVRVARVQGQRPFDQRRARRPAEGLGPREAEGAEEPPVVAVGRRRALEQRELLLVALLPAAEADEAVDAVGCG